MTLPTPATMANQDALRMAKVLQDIGGDGAAVSSGWMSCDQPGSWATYAAGLGLEGPLAAADIDRVVDFYHSRQRPAQVQVHAYQHPSVMGQLKARGFTQVDESQVLAFDLSAELSELTPHGFRFVRVDPTQERDCLAFAASQGTGFFEDKPVPAGMDPITQRVIQLPRAQLWLIERDGHVVGCGGLEPFENMAVLIGACVHPEARRIGLHSAFIRFRLMQAQQQGLDYALIASAVNGPTQRNATRVGFTPAYTHATMALPVSPSPAAA